MVLNAGEELTEVGSSSKLQEEEFGSYVSVPITATQFGFFAH